MSTGQNIQYGIREFDLSVQRQGEANYKLIQLPNAKVISTVDVPDECYLHLGTAQSPGLDLREYDFLKREDGKTFGQVYLENPAGTGTLRLLVGVDVEAERSEDVTVEQINNTTTVTDDGNFNVAGVVSVQEDTPLDVSAATVTTDLTDDITRSAGTVRVEDVTAISDSTTTTGAANAASLTLGDYRQAVNVQLDLSGTATLTVEVSVDGGSTWLQFDSVSVDSTDDVLSYDAVAFADVRAHVNANLNTMTIASKGV